MTGLFKTKQPEVQEPEPQPDPDDPKIQAAKRRRIAMAQQASGIRSAVLTRPGGKETLGA